MQNYDPFEAQELFPSDRWEPASASQSNSGPGIEWNFGAPGMVGLRQTDYPDGPVLAFDQDEWWAFQEAVKAGQTRK